MKDLIERIKEYETFLQDNLKTVQTRLDDKNKTILGIGAVGHYITKKEEYENYLNKLYELFPELRGKK